MNERAKNFQGGRMNLVTHSGIFHADDVFATALLKLFFGNECNVVRTTDPEKIKMWSQRPDAIVYDIGLGQYDHHQADKEIRENGIPYAAFGLLWRRFGMAVADQVCLSEQSWSKFCSSIENTLVIPIDAIDNGVQIKTDQEFNLYSISSAISSFNVSWDEELEAFDSNRVENEQFMRAVHFAYTVLINTIAKTVSKLKAEDRVKEFLRNARKGVMEMSLYLPWQEVLLSNEDPENPINFVIFPSQRGGFNVQAVPIELGSFETRIPFPESIRGKSQKEIEEESGVSDVVFCHNSGFLANVNNIQSAYKLIEWTISYKKPSIDLRLRKAMDED